MSRELPEEWGDPNAPEPTEPGLAKKVRDQAAKIERLKELFNTSQDELIEVTDELTEAKAQLAEMRTALEKTIPEMKIALSHVVPSLQPGISKGIEDAIDAAEKALATGAGKAAADVLEYAIKYITGEHKGTTGLWSKVQVYLEQQRGHREEGRDDG